MVPRGCLKTFSFVAVSVEDMLIRCGGGEDFLIGSSDLWIEEEEREGDGVFGFIGRSIVRFFCVTVTAPGS